MRSTKTLRKLKNLQLLSYETYKSLFVSGPGILYGLPKTHKPNFCAEFPFRPIFAAYNTASYKLATFFVPILAPLTTNEFTIIVIVHFHYCNDSKSSFPLNIVL